MDSINWKTLITAIKCRKYNLYETEALAMNLEEDISKYEMNQSDTKQKSINMWQTLPDVLLEEIFALLSIKERHNASQVCRNWYRIFLSPQVWSTFILDDLALTKRKYNYYLGYQRILDHYRTQIFLNRVGKHLRVLILKPIESFFNLYEFIRILSYYAEYFDDNPLAKLHTLDFTFSCHQTYGREQERGGNQELVFGTGGKLLQALKSLISNLKGLQHLTLRELLLEPNEAQYLLDDVAINCCQTLKSLKVINCSKIPYPILHVGIFININKLVISPQHLNDDVVLLLAESKLRDLWIVQTKYTELCWPVSIRAWRECRKINPKLRIHLAVTEKVDAEILWQECAAVKSIIYDTPYCTIKSESILMIVSLYSRHLEYFAFYGLPKFHMNKQFSKRADTSLVLLCQTCPNLRTLIIRELLSTATLLVIITTAQSLTRFVVRRNAIIKKFDWKKQNEWSDEFYKWIKIKSRSYEDTYEEVSKIMGKKWLPLNDKEFKFLSDITF